MATDGFGCCTSTFEGGGRSTDDVAGLDRGSALAAELGCSCVEVPSCVQPAGPEALVVAVTRR